MELPRPHVAPPAERASRAPGRTFATRGRAGGKGVTVAVLDTGVAYKSKGPALQP